jgi:hypothetical protein
MANQSLINAAQRMYSAKAAKAQKDIAPILQGFELGTGKIMEALTEKKKEQEEKAAKTTESFKDIILKSGTARPQLTNELKALQDEYYKNIRISEGVFRKGKTKQEAIERNNEIAGTLKLWEEDLRSRDLATARPANISDFEGIDGMANELSFRDDTLADDLIFKPDGVYTKNIKNEEVRLSKHEQPVGIFDEGVDILNALQKASVQEGKKGNDWDSYVLPELSTNLDRLMRSNNWGSLLFDDIGSFNWATEQMKQEFPDADLSKPEVYEAKRQELRDMVKADPKKYKKEFEEDVVRAYKMNYDDAAAKEKAKTNEQFAKDRSRTPLSELQLSKINTFINSVNRGGDIQFPNGDIGKKVNGRIQLYMENGKKYDGIAPISIDQAMDRANIPVDMRSEVLSGSVSSSAVLAGENPTQPKTPEQLAQDLIKLYSTKK